MRRLKDLEQRIASMPGDQLLEELVTYAALHFDALNAEDDDMETISRVIQARLAETGIAQKHHGEACRFMRGEDRCRCSAAHWSWPRKGCD